MQLRKVVIHVNAKGQGNKVLEAIGKMDPEITWLSGTMLGKQSYDCSDAKYFCIDEKGYLTWSQREFSPSEQEYRKDWVEVDVIFDAPRFKDRAPETIEAHGHTYKLVRE